MKPALSGRHEADGVLCRPSDHGAARLLGEAYLSGEVIPPDPQAGETLLRQAIKSGDTTAMTVLGKAYLDGPLSGNPNLR